ncbi:YbgC/FadM family acyl-CoA thioesterase [Anaerotignum sp.]
MKPYQHKVQYYETDKMGITHHSNYIRWMEEARTDFLAEYGWPYDKMEEAGIFSPVTAVECKYKASTTFADLIDITISVAEFKGIKLKLKYEMRKQDGALACEAYSEHCFLNGEGKIIRLQKEQPALHQLLTDLAEKA